MRSTEAFAILKNSQVVNTAEASQLLDLSPSATVNAMKRLSEDGLVSRLYQGIWMIGEVTDPRVLAPYLTVPYPCYVSGLTGLADHGMIDQIPKAITVVSLDRAQRIETKIGNFEVHHIHPQLFLGFTEDERGFAEASAEKSFFDTIYLSAAKGSAFMSMVEVEFPEDFNFTQLQEWCTQIPSGRLRAMTTRYMEEVLHENGVGFRGSREL